MCPRKGAIQKCFDKRDFELIPQALRNRTLCLHQAWCCSQGFEIWASRSVSNHVSQARLLILQTSDLSSAKNVYMCGPADQDEFKKVQKKYCPTEIWNLEKNGLHFDWYNINLHTLFSEFDHS